MTTKLFGISGSRAIRSLWAIEETGIEYEHVKTDFGAGSKTDEYLAINPNGRVPALMDGDLALFESMAINLYLIKKYAPALYPSNAADEARALQWTVWGVSEIEPLQMQLVIQKLFLPEAKRSQSVIDTATNGLARPLAVLNKALADRDYLLGEAFSVADLNLAGEMQLLGMVSFDLAPYPNVSGWMDRCYARPALARAQAL